jgi:hypothetical protein
MQVLLQHPVFDGLTPRSLIGPPTMNNSIMEVA